MISLIYLYIACVAFLFVSYCFYAYIVYKRWVEYNKENNINEEEFTFLNYVIFWNEYVNENEFQEADYKILYKNIIHRYSDKNDKLFKELMTCFTFLLMISFLPFVNFLLFFLVIYLNFYYLGISYLLSLKNKKIVRSKK